MENNLLYKIKEFILFMKSISLEERKTIYEEIKVKLEKRGYSVSPNYGLILKNEDDESAIADIRFFERRIVLPWWYLIEHKKETEEVRNLRKVLIQEGILFREDRS